MKKLICLIAAISLLFSIAIAETDFSSMSYDELISNYHELVAEIMSRPEWKEVPVPAGVWKIGEDIPEGTYSIKTYETYCVVEVWRRALDDYTDKGLYYTEVLTPEKPCGKIELPAGMLIKLGNIAVFAPPVILGF